MVNLALTLSLHSVLRASFYYHNVRPERHPLKPSTIVSHPHFLCSSNAVALSTLFTLFSLPLLFQIVFDVKAHTEKNNKKKTTRNPHPSFRELHRNSIFPYHTISFFFVLLPRVHGTQSLVPFFAPRLVFRISTQFLQLSAFRVARAESLGWTHFQKSLCRFSHHKLCPSRAAALLCHTQHSTLSGLIPNENFLDNREAAKIFFLACHTYFSLFLLLLFGALLRSFARRLLLAVELWVALSSAGMRGRNESTRRCWVESRVGMMMGKIVYTRCHRAIILSSFCASLSGVDISERQSRDRTIWIGDVHTGVRIDTTKAAMLACGKGIERGVAQ